MNVATMPSLGDFRVPDQKQNSGAQSAENAGGGGMQMIKTIKPVVQTPRPQVYVMGEIECCSGGSMMLSEAYCSWELKFDHSNWWVISGQTSGDTFVSEINSGGNPLAQGSSNVAVWNHPIDAHLACCSTKGWPKLDMVVRGKDEHSRNQLIGYGSVYLPMRPGAHELIVPCWRPMGVGVYDRLRQLLLGISPDITVEKQHIAHGVNANRSCINAETTCEVLVRLNIVVQDFVGNDIHVSEAPPPPE